MPRAQMLSSASTKFGRQELVSPAGSHYDVLEYFLFEMSFADVNAINGTDDLM